VVNPSHIVRKVTTTRMKSTRGLNNYYNMLTYQPAKWVWLGPRHPCTLLDSRVTAEAN